MILYSLHIVTVKHLDSFTASTLGVMESFKGNTLFL